MKNTILGLSAGILLISASFHPPKNRKIRIYPKPIYHSDSIKLVAMDTLKNRLDSCFLNTQSEWSFGKIKSGIYNLEITNLKRKTTTQYSRIQIDEPNYLHKISIINPTIIEANSNIEIDSKITKYEDDIKVSKSYRLDCDKAPKESIALTPSSIAEKSAVPTSMMKTKKTAFATPTSKSTRLESTTAKSSIKSESAPIKETIESGSANVLTAGLWNDLDHWDKFEKTHKDPGVKNAESTWGIHLINHRFGVEVKNNKGQKVIGEVIMLKDNDGNILWTSKTDNRGKAELWYKPFEDISTEKKISLNLFISLNEKTISLGKISPTGSGYMPFIVSEKTSVNPAVDVCFVVDATGSMGDEINYLKAELMDVMMNLQKSAPCSPIRLSSVFYRDHGDEYLTKKMPFVNRIDDVVGFVNEQYAGGGGDFPEAVHSGLSVAINELEWNQKALTKIIFLILDAPPHAENASDIRKLMQMASEKGIKIIPIVASGIDQSTEFCMKYLAAGTGGDYIYISDHSGVGNSHLKPTGVVEDIDLLNTQIIKTMKKYSQWEGCENVDTIINSIQPRIDIFGNQQIQITSFPNPASKFMKVKSNIMAQRMAIYQMNGSLVQEKTDIKSNEIQFDVSNMSDGIYVLNVTIEGKIFTNKFFVNKGIQGLD